MNRRKRLVTFVILCAVLGVLTASPRALGQSVGWANVIQQPLATATHAVAVWLSSMVRLLRTPDTLALREHALAACRADAMVRIATDARRAALHEELQTFTTLTAHGTPIPAHVLSMTRTALEHSLLVRTGGESIPVRAPVLASGALIGVVRGDGASRARVQLLGDPHTRIAVQRASAIGDIGVLEALGTGLAITHIPHTVPLDLGDAIVTGLANEAIPDGLPIGTITEIQSDPDGFFRTAALDPLVDIRAVSFVTILPQMFP